MAANPKVPPKVRKTPRARLQVLLFVKVSFTVGAGFSYLDCWFYFNGMGG
jgi:hypothetical protein